MIVYRYLGSEELQDFLHKDMHKVGSTYKEKVPQNTHKYKNGVRYLHFFKHLRDFPTIQKVLGKPEGRFLCKFDIPLRMLITSKGTGYYVDYFSGYDYGCEKIKEFAVETSKIQPDYLVDFIFDEKCDLTVEQIKEQFAIQAGEEESARTFE